MSNDVDSLPNPYDEAPCGLVKFDLDGKILSVNRTFASLTGRAKEELIGSRLDTLAGGPGRMFFQTHLFPMLRMTGQIEEAFLLLLSASGVEVPTMFNASTHDGACLGAFFPVRRRSQYEDDILSAKRAAEQAGIEKDEAYRALQSLRSELERRVDERTQDLEAANAEMEAFNYSIAHDLRTPLRAIASTAGMLLEDAGETLSPVHRDLLSRQAENAVKLGRLIDDLLKYSRLSRIEFEKVAFDMTSLATQTVTKLRATGAASRCTFEVEPGMAATGDSTLVERLLQSLLHNACKFWPAGGCVIIGSAGEGTFFVRDGGVGFDTAYGEKIFIPFQRLVADDEFPGNGIGLANVHRIVRRHGGKVWAESEPGKGATFYFTLG